MNSIIEKYTNYENSQNVNQNNYLTLDEIQEKGLNPKKYKFRKIKAFVIEAILIIIILFPFSLLFEKIHVYKMIEDELLQIIFTFLFPFLITITFRIFKKQSIGEKICGIKYGKINILSHILYILSIIGIIYVCVMSFKILTIDFEGWGWKLDFDKKLFILFLIGVIIAYLLYDVFHKNYDNYFEIKYNINNQLGNNIFNLIIFIYIYIYINRVDIFYDIENIHKVFLIVLFLSLIFVIFQSRKLKNQVEIKEIEINTNTKYLTIEQLKITRIPFKSFIYRRWFALCINSVIAFIFFVILYNLGYHEYFNERFKDILLSNYNENKEIYCIIISLLPGFIFSIIKKQTFGEFILGIKQSRIGLSSIFKLVFTFVIFVLFIALITNLLIIKDNFKYLTYIIIDVLLITFFLLFYYKTYKKFHLLYDKKYGVKYNYKKSKFLINLLKFVFIYGLILYFFSLSYIYLFEKIKDTIKTNEIEQCIKKCNEEKRKNPNGDYSPINGMKWDIDILIPCKHDYCNYTCGDYSKCL